MSTEKPILFSTPMVKAILDGKKTQTRRITPMLTAVLSKNNSRVVVKKCKYDVGDILWVRETTRIVGWELESGEYFVEYKDGQIHALDIDDDNDSIMKYIEKMESKGIIKFPDGIDFEKDDFESAAYEILKPFPWRPSIFMNKAATRIFLRVTNVRLESLHDITEEDAIAEGCTQYETETDWLTAKYGFQVLWESINGDGSWKENPYVWVIEFESIT